MEIKWMKMNKKKPKRNQEESEIDKTNGGK